MRKLFFLVSAVVALIVAVFMLFFPITFLNWFLKAALPTGAQLDQIGAAVGGLSGLLGLIKLGFGLFGAVLIGVAIIRYFASSSAAAALKNKLMLGFGVADLIGLILTLMAAFNAKFNGMTWILVIVWLVLVLFEAYFFFMNPEA
jgi:hypothetical protein